MELVIRFGFGANIPWVKRTDGGALLAICGPDMTVLRTPVETHGEDMTTVAEFEVGEGERVPFVLTYAAVASPGAGCDRSRAGAASTPRNSGRNGPAAAPTAANIATWCCAR